MALLWAAACGRPSDVGGGVSDGTLRVALAADVVTLDPALYTDVVSDHVASQIHETLFAVDFDLRIVPLLAERLDQPDDSTYLITLRQGVRFHNGDEMTADDVVFSLNRVIDPATRSPRANRLTEPLGSGGRIEALDRHTVRISLGAPYAPFMERLTQPYTAVLSQRAVVAGGSYAQQPVGTGPFKFVERKVGESVTLERNIDYWGEQAQVARLVFRPIPDNATRVASLEAGEVEHVVSLPADDLDRLTADPRITAQVKPAIAVTFLGFNNAHGPFADPLLRSAVANAVDRDELVRTIYGGVGEVARTALGPSSWAFEPSAEAQGADPARARELLARSGYRGEEIELVVNNASEPVHVAERLQAVLKEQIGIAVRLNVLEWGAYLDYLKTNDRHQMYLISWTGGADPDSTLFPLFHSKNWGAAGNRAWYKNDRVDALLSQAQLTIDQPTRADLYREAQRLIAQDVPIVPIRHGVNVVGTSTRAEGFRLHPLNRPIYTAVKLR